MAFEDDDTDVYYQLYTDPITESARGRDDAPAGSSSARSGAGHAAQAAWGAEDSDAEHDGAENDGAENDGAEDNGGAVNLTTALAAAGAAAIVAALIAVIGVIAVLMIGNSSSNAAPAPASTSVHVGTESSGLGHLDQAPQSSAGHTDGSI